MPTVSVVVPVYNRAHLLGETLRALLAQTRPADEIIVIDDGSTDGSTDVARSFGTAVRVVETSNGGPARARNRGLAEAQGDFIQFMDSDDLPTPRFLASRLEAITGTGADIAYGPWIPAWIEGRRVAVDGFVRQTAAATPPLDAFLCGWVLFIPNALTRRTLLEDTGGYPDGLLTGEDLLLLFRLLRSTDRLAHTDRSLLLVRQHPEGQISACATLSAQRLVDELILTGAVRSALADGSSVPVVPSRAAVRAWERRRARAFALARRAGLIPPMEAGLPPGLPMRAAATAEGLVARVSGRFRYHRFGHRLGKHFHPSPIATEHVDEVRELGLDFVAMGPRDKI